MTSTAPSPSPTPSTAGPAVPRPDRARSVAVWLNALLAVVGAVLALAGAAVLGVFGFDGVTTTDRQDLSTPTSALVSGTASISTGGFVDALGNARATISAQAQGGRPVFVGVGRAADVERYLAGAPVDEVTSIDANPFGSSYDVQRRTRPGTATPGAPGAQSFWLARSTSADVADLRWKVRDGDYRVVVMNADGSRSVLTQTRFGADVPYAPWIALGVLVGGLLLTAGAIVSIRSRRP